MGSPLLEKARHELDAGNQELNQYIQSMEMLKQIDAALKQERCRIVQESRECESAIQNRNAAVQQVQAEHNAMMDRYIQLSAQKQDAEDEEKANRIQQELASLARAMVQNEQDQARIQNEIGMLEERIRENETKCSELKQNREKNQSMMEQVRKKCREKGKTAGQKGSEMRRLSQFMETQAKGFQSTGEIGFGSGSAMRGSGFKSDDARNANDLANQFDRMARGYRKLTETEDDWER